LIIVSISRAHHKQLTFINIVILEAPVPSPDCTTYNDSIENVQTTDSTSRIFFMDLSKIVDL